jgi:DNA-binding CsgD family transcriptional regulator
VRIGPTEPAAVPVACPACRSPLVLTVARPWAEGGTLPAPAVPLTPRESETLRLLAAGFRGRQIARRLGVSIHTARAHVKAILRKFSAHSQAELVDRLHPLGGPVRPSRA